MFPLVDVEEIYLSVVVLCLCMLYYVYKVPCRYCR